MSESLVAKDHPKKVKLEKGKEYHWCACGRSATQPFCDGSHSGTDITPKAFTAKESGEAYLCQCKQTKNPPYCDGTHKTLDIPESSDDDRKNVPPLPRNTNKEPFVEFIHDLAKNGLDDMGSHGPVQAMGVPREQLPKWDDLQILTAQLAKRALPDDADVDSQLIIGRNARKPLCLDIPLLVSDRSFGALSEEAKIALARGAEKAGTAICSGEGGMLPQSQQSNSRYIFELGPAKFGYEEEILTKVQAFHFKAGQAAKTGIGGHLPGSKVQGKIAEIRGLEEGQTAISPANFPDLVTVDDFKRFSEKVRGVSGGIPVGFKMSANHIEEDIAFALAVGVDYIILDGRGGGTGAAPLLLRDHISVPTLPALARARRFLDKEGAKNVTLIVTGGLRVPTDFTKALCLGADGVALANASIQAIGCVGARICHTNQCPTGVATMDPELRKRLKVDDGAERLGRFFTSSVSLMKVLARACGHESLSSFSSHDLTSWKKSVAELTGVRFSGVG